jgi:protein-tyrosine-phosphatase
MNIDDRLDRLTERHEALPQSVELLRTHGNELSERLARQAERSDRENAALNHTLRRAIRMAVTETRNERRRRQTLDEYIAKPAAAQLITEEKMQVLEDRLARFIDASRGGGNGHG